MPTSWKPENTTTNALQEKNQEIPVCNIPKKLMTILTIVCLEAENLLREQGELMKLVLPALCTSSSSQVQSPGFSLCRLPRKTARWLKVCN